MHATDIVGYGFDGDLYCPFCAEKRWTQSELESGGEGLPWPEFASDEGWRNHCCYDCREPLDDNANFRPDYLEGADEASEAIALAKEDGDYDLADSIRRLRKYIENHKWTYRDYPSCVRSPIDGEWYGATDVRHRIEAIIDGLIDCPHGNEAIAEELTRDLSPVIL